MDDGVKMMDFGEWIIDDGAKMMWRDDGRWIIDIGAKILEENYGLGWWVHQFGLKYEY